MVSKSFLKKKKIPSFKEWGNLTESGIWLPAAQKPLRSKVSEKESLL